MPQHRVFQPFALREAQQFLDLRAHVKLRHALVQRRDERHRRDVLHQGAELGLLALAGADVAHHAGHQQPGRRPQRVQADLDGELAAVLALPSEFHRRAIHRPGPGIGEVPLPAPDVSGPQPLGHQQLDGLAQQFTARVAEQPFRLLIDQDDGAVLVDDHHGIGQRLNQVAEALRRPGRQILLPGRQHQRRRLFPPVALPDRYPAGAGQALQVGPCLFQGEFLPAHASLLRAPNPRLPVAPRVAPARPLP
jgi:hypothetical protein